MRIVAYSDLHNEFGAPFSPAAEDADLVILAGDVDLKSRGVKWAAETFACPVAYIPGNHEYYGGHLGRTLLKMIDAGNERVKVLDCDEMVVGDVRILGATGWTDYTATGNPVLAAWDAQSTMSDFKRIRHGSHFGRVSPGVFIERAQYTKRWLRQKLSEPFEGKTIIVTHHAPSVLSLATQGNSGNHLDASYANRWEDLFGDEVDLWFHGHSHFAVDYECAGTRVISNPRGYPGEFVSGFQPDFVIHV